MTRRAKLLAKARHVPHGLSFAEFEALLKHLGFVFKRQSGSHRVWMAPDGRPLPVQADGSKAKSYQVKQALRLVDAQDG